MAGYGGMILTREGLNLQAKAQLGGQLIITRIVLGDGLLAENQAVEDLTDLKNPLKSLGVHDCEVVGDGTSRVRAFITNDELTAGFFIREIGVFAKIGEDGAEKLYSYTNAGEKSDFLPLPDVTRIEEMIEIYIVVGNAQQVTAIINDRVMLATKLDLAEHNQDPTAHRNMHIIGQWQANEAVKVGYIRWPNNVAAYNLILECVQAGVTSQEEPTWPGPEEKITDNTALWKVIDIKAISDGVPLGSILIFPFDSLPTGFLPCDGTYLDREAYQDLFNVIGTKYGEGDGTKTFNLPDLRGYFVRGLDDGKGIDQGRELGSVQGDAIRNIPGSLGTIPVWGSDATGPFTHTSTGFGKYSSSPADTGNTVNVDFDPSRIVPTAEENRPKNIAMVYAIKVFGAATNTGEVDVAKLAESAAELTNTLQQPAGSVLAFAGKKAPSGYLVCDGGEVGRATYPDLFAAIGTIYGEGDGKDTFNLPDLRGEFLRGADLNRGVDPGRKLGSWQKGSIIQGDYTASKTTETPYNAVLGNLNLKDDSAETFRTNFGLDKIANESFMDGVGNVRPLSGATSDSQSDTFQAGFSRPRNVAILYCIKAFGSKTNVGQIDLTELANEMKNKTNYTDFASSHTKAGYQLFPNGGIRQRGVSAKLAPNSGVAVVLPLAMPDENYTVSATPIAVGPSSAGNGVGIVINNSSQFTIYNWGPIDIAGVHWTAEW